MNKKVVSYKLQYYLSLIPFSGFLIAWITSWLNIYRKTNESKYILLHFIFWIFPICVAGGLIVICMMTFMANLTSTTYVICGLIVSYAACSIMSLSCVGISKGIIDRFDSKSIM